MAKLAFEDVNETLREQLRLINLVTQETDEYVKASQQRVRTVSGDEIQEIKQLREEINKLKKALEDKKTTQTEEIKLQERLEKLRKGELDETIRIREEIKKESAERRKQQKALIEQTDAYAKLRNETNKAQLEFKKLAAQFDINDKRAQAALKRFNQLDNSLRAINNAARDGRRDVGRYGIALDGLGKNALSLGTNLIGAFGLVAGVQLFADVVRDSINIVRDFQSAQSELSAVLGKNKDEITGLTELTKELGSTTSFTASEVTRAATELAKLGFNTDQIQDSLGGVLDGAVALGAEIPETAALVASSLKAFGLEASETDRVVSTLAVSTTKSSLDFSKLQTALGNVAPAAASFGASIEETTALLGLITDKGIDASTAGSQLRNIFITLSKEGLTLDEALEKITNSQDSLTTATELFDKRGATVALALAEQKDRIDDLTSSITDQDAALEQLVEKRLDNLDGDLKILASTYEGLVLSIESGNGAINRFLRNAVQGFTRLIGVVTDLVGAGKDYSNGLRDQENELRKNKAELDARFRLLRQGNLTEQQRNNLIEETNNKFGEFLPTLITLKDTEEDLNRIQKQANDELVRRIILKTREAEITEIATQLAEKQIELSEAQIVLTKEQEKRLFSREQKAAALRVKRLQNEISLLQDQLNLEDDLTNQILGRLGISDQDVQDQGQQAGQDFGKGFNDGFKDSVDQDDQLIGALEIQRALVAKLRQEREEASIDELAAITQKLQLAEEELKRLENIGKQLQDNVDIQTDAISVLERNEELLANNRVKNEEDTQDSIRTLLQETADFADELGDKLLDRSKRRSQEEIEALNSQLAANKRQQDVLNELAAQGDTNAAKSAAKLAENERQLTQQIQSEKDKQIKDEAILTGLKLLASQAGQPNAVPKTIADAIAVASGVVNGIKSFFTGTKTTLGQEDKAVRSGKDGHLIWADKDEAILNPKQTSDVKIGKGRTTQDVVNIVKSYDRDQIRTLSNISMPIITTTKTDENNSVLAKKLDVLADRIDNISMSVNMELDVLDEALDLKIRKGRKQTTKRTFLG